MNEKYLSELRQLGGLLLVLGLSVMLFPISDAVVGVNGLYTKPNGIDPSTDLLQLFTFIGDICVIALGLLGMAVGYLLLIRDYGSPMLTLLAVIWEQATFIEWITTMVNIGKGANLDDPDGRFFFATGLLTVFFLCFLLYGSLGLILFAVYDYQTKDPPTRNASAYRTRLLFYSFLYFGVGVCRFLLPGIKVMKMTGTGGLLEKPVPVVGGPIIFPSMEIAMGCICVVLGLWGMGRGMNILNFGGTLFGNMVGFNYVVYVTLKVLVEIGLYAPPPAVASAAKIAVVFLPAHIIIPFLDDKARSSPEQIDPNKDPRMMSQPDDPEQPYIEEQGEEVNLNQDTIDDGSMHSDVA